MRKKSAAKSLSDYRAKASEAEAFVKELRKFGVSSASLTEAHDHALVLLFSALEDFLLSICVGIANRSPEKLYETTGVEFGRHLTADQSAYLITGDDYFSMKGYDGFLGSLRRVAGKTSNLISKCKEDEHKEAITILVSLRNYAAHGSSHSSKKALDAMRKWEPNRKNLGRAGSWLKVSIDGCARIDRLISQLDKFAAQIAAIA